MRSRTLLGVLLGLVTAAVALGVGELVAAYVRPAAAPVIAVGNRVITLTPETTKQKAIDAAGTNDKVLLLGGIYLLLAVFGALIGVQALHRLWQGLVGVAIIGAVGVYCALTANASQVGDIVPTLVGTAVAMVLLTVLVRTVALTGHEAADNPRLTERRTVLQALGAGAVVAAITGFGGRALQHSRYDVTADRAEVELPAAKGESGAVPLGADLGKSPLPWATPNGDFYRIDTALAVPQLSSRDWRLRIHGMVDKPITIDFAQLLARPQLERWITLCCVSNEVGGDLISNSLFRGALLADLLRETGVHPDADQLLMTSVDGMTIGAPAKAVMDGRTALLAVGMNGKPLPIEHGYPVRVVVPGLYGYVSACKWVVDIEATTFAKRQPYWIEREWATAAPIRMSSRIDRPKNNAVLNAGEIAVIAGVAWDQHVGVSKVEVKIDDEPWRTARLASVPSTDTWRQWVLAWTPQKSGQVRITVRATDAQGTVQDTTHRDVFPSGSSGLHSVTVHAVV
jgi:DMSO/TMAO reductase YedYZ molybdopterin-dependent catalytic subunit